MTDAPKVSLTLHDLDPTQVAAVMAAVGGETPAPAKAAPKKTTKPKADSKPKEEPKPKEPEAPAEAEEETPDEKLTLDTVREALKAYRQKHSKEAAEAIIKGSGASSLSSIPEEKFDWVMQQVSKEPEAEDQWD